MITTIRNKTELNRFSEAHFRFVLKASATWCGPCKKIAPEFTHLSNAFAALWYAEFDVDEAKDVSDFYNISSMPTFFLVEQGQIKQTLQGPTPTQLRKAVSSFAQ